jgi:hypothetical protein
MSLNQSISEQLNIPALLKMTNEATEIPSSSVVFWALEPRLPDIAVQAAVEFDWLIQGKHGQPVPNASRDSINKLCWLLSEAIGETHLDTDSKAFVDTLGLNLFTKAYNDSHAHPVKTRHELMSAINQLITSLGKAQQESEVEEDVLVRMRDFCVALSEYAASYRQMIYGNRQGHPYRK